MSTSPHPSFSLTSLLSPLPDQGPVTRADRPHVPEHHPLKVPRIPQALVGWRLRHQERGQGGCGGQPQRQGVITFLGVVGSLFVRGYPLCLLFRSFVRLFYHYNTPLSHDQTHARALSLSLVSCCIASRLSHHTHASRLNVSSDWFRLTHVTLPTCMIFFWSISACYAFVLPTNAKNETGIISTAIWHACMIMRGTAS